MDDTVAIMRRWWRGAIAARLPWLALALGIGWPPAALGAGEPLPDALACRGNEPFWNLEIDGAGATYERLGEAPIALVGNRAALDYLPEPELVWRGRGAPLTGDLVALITRAPCRDTMSDREGQTEFAFGARISLPGGAVLVGCCRARPDPDDWSRFLVDLLPAIEACLGETPGAAPRVTKAWPMNRGMVGVRTRNGDGGWFACIAPALGGEIDRFEPITDGERLPGEGIVVFSPNAGGPPGGECYEHERALGADGQAIGWLSYDTC